ncbi:hypothetical protein RI367_004480 [Sorochytrium milnesiophthora]
MTVPQLSSLPLQIIIHVDYFYAGFALLCTAFGLIYKGAVLPYPSGVYAIELSILVLLAGMESTRLYLGSCGNKTEAVVPLALFLALSGVSAFGYLYYILWQTYVLRWDVWINAVGVAFIPLQLVAGIATVVRVAREKY